MAIPNFLMWLIFVNCWRRAGQAFVDIANFRIYIFFYFCAVSLHSPEARLAGQKPGLSRGSSEIQKILKSKIPNWKKLGQA